MTRLSDKLRSAGNQFAAAGPGIMPGWVINVAIGSLAFISVVGVLVILAAFLGASSSISIPLILAMVIGMIAYPLVEKMVARGIPAQGAAVAVLVLLLAIVVATLWVTFAGVLSQWPSIQAQIQSGIAEGGAGLGALRIDPNVVQDIIVSARQTASGADAPPLGGLASILSRTLASGLSGVFALFFGIFIGAMLLYYVLADFPNIISWMGSHLGGLPEELGTEIVGDAVRAMRGYFSAMTVSGVVVATVIGAVMLVMGLPLAIPVALVTFLTNYIPFFGAILSGAFAFFIALGAGGFSKAVTILVVILVTQNLLQSIINARLMGDSLNLSPIVVLVATMMGGIFGGLLGAALGAPVAALLVSAGGRLAAVDFDQLPEE
ncbi:MAG: AI-2E family transporter [Coriobacteriia bacterium]|nr:AI-2E family transporter [Coriobacteriia bacterium]